MSNKDLVKLSATHLVEFLKTSSRFTEAAKEYERTGGWIPKEVLEPLKKAYHASKKNAIIKDRMDTMKKEGITPGKTVRCEHPGGAQVEGVVRTIIEKTGHFTLVGRRGNFNPLGFKVMEKQ
jgi:hypothetical protein